MSFVEKILSGKYPNIEHLWRKEIDKIIDEVFDFMTTKGDFEEMDEFVPAKSDSELLQEERERHEATKRLLDVARQEKATLQAKLDAAKNELLT